MPSEVHEQLVEDFLEHKRFDWAESTIDSARYNMVAFFDWMEEKGVDWRDCKPKHLRDMAAERGWSETNSALHGLLCILRPFYDFHLGAEDNPLADMKVKRRPPGPQRTLSEKEVAKVMDFLEPGVPLDELDYKGDPRIGGILNYRFIRDRAMISLMLDTGFRNREVCNLRIEHLELDEQKIVAKVKGGEWRTGVFSQATRDRLAEWLEFREHIAVPGAPWLFVSSYRGKQLSTGGLRANFYKLSKQIGIKEFSPHVLRRTMATSALRRGAPTRLVQIMGGWKDLEMVTRYSQALTEEDVRGFLVTNEYEADHVEQEPAEDRRLTDRNGHETISSGQTYTSGG